MGDKSLERLREIGGRYWQPTVSLIAVFIALLSSLGDFLKNQGINLPLIGSQPVSRWTIVGVFILVFVIIRFPRVAANITRWIFGQPAAPSDLGRIFRGPRPYGAQDKMPGRKAEVDNCWAIIQQQRFLILDGESGCGKTSFINAGLILNTGNYYTLRAFTKEHAESVLHQLFGDLCKDNPVIRQQVEDFAQELVLDLLRPPRDARLFRADEKTVLPVELQTVGLMIESLGVNYFSVGGLKKLGGKGGLLQRYVEDAKTFVWRKTGVEGNRALLVLRELVRRRKQNGRGQQRSSPTVKICPSSKSRQFLTPLAKNILSIDCRGSGWR